MPVVLHPTKIEAILDGRATRFTIPIDPQPAMNVAAFYSPSRFRKGFEPIPYYSADTVSQRRLPEIHCSYSSNLLYVQEEWSTIGATSQDLILKATISEGYFTDRNKQKPWQPAETMPKKAARLWLKVLNVYIYRVHNINSRKVLFEEGPIGMPEHDAKGFLPAYKNFHKADVNPFVYGERVAFQQWFIEVYGRDARDQNVWVWSILFERINSPLKL